MILFLLGFLTITKAQSLDEVIRFIKDNPTKSSVYLIENGVTTINYNGNQPMPLASAAKTIIAIEFAKQAAAKKFLPNTKIAVKELSKYYIVNTDGGAQSNWLKSIDKRQGDSVTLLAVAKGMIKFSSNASTEFLQDFLGLKQINKNLELLGLKEHDPLYYFTAAALMTCLKPNNRNEQDWITELKAMPAAVYYKKCEEAHLKLKTDTSFVKSFNFSNLSFSIQKIWSDKLVKATTSNYANLMQKISSKTYLDPTAQLILESILEWPMEYAGNKVQFDHLGQKGSSTAFVLTDAFYMSQKNGDNLACAFFFNDLSTVEGALVNKNFGKFEANMITNQAFRNKLAEALK
ncbi:MAG: serine hydrolase [Bacteroidota bacterium]